MKSNWNPTLHRWTRCVPRRSRIMTQAAVVENEHVVCTKDGWEDADSLTGLTKRDDGSLVITGSISDKISHTTQDGYLTDLDNASPFSVAQVEWKGGDPDGFEISKVIAYLHPKRTGAAQTVAKWGCQIKMLYQVADDLIPILNIVPLNTILWVEETGSIAHEVTFDFAQFATRPRPKMFGPPLDPTHTYMAPTMYVCIYAAKEDGSPADNCGWGRNSAAPSETDAYNVMKGVTLTVVNEPDYLGWFTVSDNAMVPYVTIQSGTYSQQTVEFTSTDFDLSATPASADEVVFVLEGSKLSGTGLTASARVPAGSWVEVKDGQTAADAGLAASRYYEMKCVLDPDANGVVSPILRRLGVEDVAIRDLSNVVDVKEIHRQVDPVTLKTYVTAAKLVAIQDGVRDFNDAITSLLSTYYIGQIQFRIYLGHPDLDRQYWMQLGTFIEPTYQAIGGAIELTAISPLALVKAKLPKFDTGTSSRTPLTYSGETLKAVYDDLLDGQIELPGRFRGPGIEDDTTTVSRYINEELEAKDMLEAIAYCAGSAVGESQGRVRTFDLYGDKAVAAVFPSNTINPVYVSPGYEHRLPEWTVKYGWSEDENRYLGEARFEHGSSLVNLGRAPLNDMQDPGDDVSKWLDDPSPPDVPDLVQLIGDRGVKFFGAGLLTLGFNSIYAYPELENGDLVAVQTDRFVAVDPNTANAVKGRLWILGVIVDHDKLGENFVVWCRDYADIFSSATAGTITVGFRRAAARVYHSVDQDFTSTDDVAFDSEEYDEGDLHDTVTDNYLVQVPPTQAGRYSVIGHFEWSDLVDPGGGLWVAELQLVAGTTIERYLIGGSEGNPADESGSCLLVCNVDFDASGYHNVYMSVALNTSAEITILGGSASKTSLSVSRVGV